MTVWCCQGIHKCEVIGLRNLEMYPAGARDTGSGFQASPHFCVVRADVTSGRQLGTPRIHLNGGGAW